MSSSPPADKNLNEAVSWEKLPHDELLRYGRGLGLDLPDTLTSDELIARVSRRRMLLVELDREALLDVIRWSRRPMRENAGKELLACEIARIDKSTYDGLSKRGLVTLARLRDIDVLESDTADQIIDKLRSRESFWQRFHRTRRRVVGSWLAKMIDGGESAESADVESLPPDSIDKPSAEPSEAARASLRRQIEDLGVVGGIAQRLRGAADDYIKVKLDEIEARIDLKLNEIDQRLAEWRDREIANRLKILRLTLGFTVVVAVLSLGYNFIKKHVEGAHEATPSAVQAETPKVD